MSDDFSDCRCGSCCLPTILAERDEAMNERDEAVKAKTSAYAALRRAEDHERESLRDLDYATGERDAAKHEARRCQDDNERLRVSLAIALELLGNVERWHMIDGTEHSLAIRKFLADTRAGR
jgi:hypothetical protein